MDNLADELWEKIVTAQRKIDELTHEIDVLKGDYGISPMSGESGRINALARHLSALSKKDRDSVILIAKTRAKDKS